MQVLFHDRADAGRQLAAAMPEGYAGRSDVIVLGLPRGGVPVASELARQMQLVLDVMPVRKLGLPGHKEYAMGAVAPDGVIVLNDEIMSVMNVAPAALDTAKVLEQAELFRRESIYRAGRPPLLLDNKVVILVDDGLATGCTMQAAVTAVRRQNPAEVIVAVPVSSSEAWEALRMMVDDIVCLSIPELFRAVGLCYENFPQTQDQEVIQILNEQR